MKALERQLSLAVCLILFQSFTSCQLPPKLDNTGTDIPYVDDPCTIEPVYMNNYRKEREDFVTVPEKYNSGGNYERLLSEGIPHKQFRLAVPKDGDVTIDVYNKSPSGFYLRAIAIKSPGEVSLLQDFTYRHGVHERFELQTRNPELFEYILIEVWPVLTSGDVRVPDDAYIGLVAHDQAPRSYQGKGPRGEPLDCDGASLCYVLSSCDRDLNLKAWARSLGLNVNEALRSGGESDRPPAAVTACLQAGFTLNVSGPGGTPAEIERDTTNGTMEQNFQIFLQPLLANPDGLLLRFGGQNEQEGKREELITNEILKDAYECWEYAPKNGDSRNGELMVTIIDSGVSELSPTDGSGMTGWTDFAHNRSTQFLRPNSLGYDFYNGNSTPNEEIEHGTSVAGAIAGSYTGKQRLSIVHHKIFNAAGSANYFGALEAIYAAADDGTDVLNLSWGISQEKAPIALGCAIKYALGKGVIVVTSAGNAKTDIDATPQWPAAYANDADYDGLITAGSYTLRDLRDERTFKRVDFSNFGPDRGDLFGFMAAYVPANSGLDTTFVFGTSISAPLVASYLLSNEPTNIKLPLADGDSEGRVLWVESNFFDPSDRDNTGGSISDHPVHVLSGICPKQ